MNTTFKLLIVVAATYCALNVVTLSVQINDANEALEYSKTLPVPRRHIFPERNKRLTACKRDETYGLTDFAFVSILSNFGGAAEKDLPMYLTSAAKLGVSLKQWSNLDNIMMVVGDSALNFGDHVQLIRAGWSICYTDAIEAPASGVSNRFIDAKLYSKLNAWALVEYTAVVYLDSDTLAIRDPVPLFTHIYVKMKNTKSLIAADTHVHWFEGKMPWQCIDDKSTFNAGVVLLTPGVDILNDLKSAIHTLPHRNEWAEQSLLDEFFKGKVYPMPSIYNGNVVEIICESEMWQGDVSQLVLIHYTVVKPWDYSFKSRLLPYIRTLKWKAGFLYVLWDNAPTFL